MTIKPNDTANASKAYKPQPQNANLNLTADDQHERPHLILVDTGSLPGRTPLRLLWNLKPTQSSN